MASAPRSERAAYRGHFAGIEGSNLARSPAPEERQTAPIPDGALTRMETGAGGFSFSASLRYNSKMPQAGIGRLN
jgi:hypothetical protein